MSVVTPELVIAGNLLVDDIVRRDGRTLMGEPGGAVLHAALAAALWGVRVGVVSVLGDDYPRRALEAFAARGIDTGGLRASGAPSLRTWLLYEPAARRLVHHLDSPTHDAVSPRADHVPVSWWAAAAVHVAPMPRRVQLGYAGRGARLLTVDPHEPVVAGAGAPGDAVFERFDGVFVSHEELHAPGPLAERASAVRAARFVAIKCAEHGGWVHDHLTGSGRAWAARTTTAVDTTGAGDAFAAGFVAGLLRGEDIERCCQRGVVSASFALEDWGARGLMAADPATAERRRAAWYDDAKTGSP